MPKRSQCAFLATIVVAFAGARSVALSQEPAEPSFEIASVKVNTSGPGRRLLRVLPGGQLSAVDVPLSDLILFAYNLQGLEFRAAGIPDWASSTNFDVAARMDASRVGPDDAVVMDDVRAMTRSLLRERFELEAHMETRERPIYALVKARGDGRLGARLHESSASCPAIVLPAGVPAPPPPPPGPGSGTAAPDLNCTGFAMPSHISARRTTMPRFAAILSIFVRRVVVDHTALDGPFDLDLDYLPDPAIAQQSVGGRGGGAPSPPGIDANLPEIFTALQEQLGLKLDSARGPVDMLVVDHAERPTSN